MDILPAVTVEVVSKMFPATPTVNIRTHLPNVLDSLVAPQLTDKPMILMALATIRAETEGFVPISEEVSQFNTSPGGPPFAMYDYRKDLGNQGPPDGERYRGRGFVQLTGRTNYATYGMKIGLGNGLVEDPAQANESGVAAKLLAGFLKDKELSIRHALSESNLVLARKLVNGGRCGIARFTEAYHIGDGLIQGVA